ncbi:MAG: FMN-binding protein [bacterium]
MKQLSGCYFSLFLAGMLYALPCKGQVFKTQKEALTEAFSDSARITRKVLFLTDEQIDKIQKRAQTKIESKIVTYYVGSKADTIKGYAFFETNIVRTKPETFMLVVNPDATIRYVEILAFYEPLDYFPTRNWLALFKNKMLNDELRPRQAIHAITGATLTVRAMTRGVRKLLAIFEVAVLMETEKENVK